MPHHRHGWQVVGGIGAENFRQRCAAETVHMHFAEVGETPVSCIGGSDLEDAAMVNGNFYPAALGQFRMWGIAGGIVGQGCRVACQ